VHQALAQVTDPIVDPDRRAWHRAQAAAGPDEDVAAELEHSAGRAQARGGPAAAAAFLGRASELTPDHELSGQRALAAAQAKQQAGMTDASLRLLALADARLMSKFDRARADLLRGRIAFSRNRGGETPAVLLKAAIELTPLDVRLARDTYLEAIRAGWFAAQLAGGASLRQIAEAARAAPTPGEPVRAADLLLDGLAVRYTDGYPSGAPILKHALRVFRDPNMSADEELRWIWFSVATAAADLLDDEAWDALATRFVQLARDRGALAMLPMALTIQIIFQILAGDLAAAGALLAEQMAVAEVTEVREPAYAAQLLAAWQGDEGMAAKLIPATTAEVEQRGEGIAVISAAWMEGVLFNGPRTRIRGELGRAHLLYGEWLRRQNRRNDAREPLRTAHTMFTVMGMNGFADRAAEELGATGENVRKRGHESASQLTAQETQIVRLVREGLSNQEIAVRLFISRRTVEWHLSKIFAKLEITSRRQLQR
jgi:DNA-binding CsgD family transcriptional regulator